ncbi:MAG: DUF2254 domain-containing protein [Candidatus Korobacteraceae bacterium]
MRAKLRSFWESTQSSYWFIPALSLAVAAAFAFFMVALDERLSDDLVTEWQWIHTRDAEGARSLLETISGSMVTVAGVVFSITIVVLALASNQFGTRVLRNFTRDRGSKWVLGIFVGTFIYSLLVLRTVQGGPGGFVPHVSILGGICLAVLSIGSLIFFIHHVVSSIQPGSVISRILEDIEETVQNMFPDQLGEGLPQSADPPEREWVQAMLSAPAHLVTSRTAGYLQSIDENTLMSAAARHDRLLEVLQRPGDYILQGMPLVAVRPAERPKEPNEVHTTDDNGISKAVSSAFIIRNQRTFQQDVRFGLQQLTMVAVRSLSTGINDPFTATQCMDAITKVLADLSTRATPSSFRLDQDGQVRIVAHALSFAELAGIALTPIRQYGRTQATVVAHALQSLERLLPCIPNASDREVLRLHMGLLAREGLEELSHESDRRMVLEHYDNSRAA